MPRALLALALLALAASASQEPPAPARPNVLWLVVEDMSPWLPCYGDATVPTPNLDRLAAQSVRYTSAFATSPVCAPARSSLITGLYATRIGTMHMRTGSPSAAALERDPHAYDEIPTYEGVPPAWARCFPELLRAAGYRCTNNAKTDYQFQAPATVWDASGGQAHWRDGPADAPWFAVFNHGGTHESQAFPDARRRPQAVAPEDVPIPPLYPETPAVRDALARTYANIAAMDAWVGGHLDALEAAGLAESTVVFFFSDHGVGLPRGKRSPYDLGTRVPLLVRLPARSAVSPTGDAGEGASGPWLRPGTTVERVVSFVDFGPTVLSLAGLAPDERLDGRAFLGPHARPGTGLAFAHADRFDGVYDRARAVSDGRFRYVRNELTDLPYLIPNAYRERLALTADLYALRAAGAAPTPEQWQLAATERPREELYDAAADPWEVHDLAADPAQAATLARLRAALDAWLADTGDLGLVLPEERMVHERLWHGDAQPATAPPVATSVDGRLSLASATPGASLGWRRAGQGPWSVYTGPFAPPPGTPLELLAHRIGFLPASATLDPAGTD